jgi:transcriptional regulator with XRE-family HTH domain
MAVNFEVVKGLLIRFVTLRIRNGDCTERQLARLVGVSQSQLHNVLKGVRPLKESLADALLKHFQIGLLDLLSELEPVASMKTAEHHRAVVLVSTPAPRMPAASDRGNPDQFRRRAS